MRQLRGREPVSRSEKFSPIHGVGNISANSLQLLGFDRKEEFETAPVLSPPYLPTCVRGKTLSKVVTAPPRLRSASTRRRHTKTGAEELQQRAEGVSSWMCGRSVTLSPALHGWLAQWW